MNSSPMMNACARPSGFGCTAKRMSIPHALPSPRSWWNIGASCGVVMTSTSRMPASSSVLSG